MKKSLYWLALLCTFISISVFAADAPFKVGVVDMNQILQNSSLMKSMNTNLTQKFKSRQDEINKATADLQNEASQLDTAATMSTSDRTKLQNKVLTDKANVQILTASFQKDLAIEKDQLLQNFMSKLSGIINKIATDGQYDVIEQQTNMLYVNPKLDITQQVLKQL